jgi:hypothetical protein
MNSKSEVILTSEAILFNLKQSLLEYALKYRIDYLVTNFACNEKIKFTSFKICPIRFELYNMHVIIKNKHLHKFDSIIKFLTEFNLIFTNFLHEQLYARVLVTIKSLHIFETLKREDLKKASCLIKEYFPSNFDYNVLNSPNKNKSQNIKNYFGFKILKLRTTWNELILNRTKRENFFKTQFHLQYDDKFLKFLLVKSNDIIDFINAHLPMTQLERVIETDCENSYWQILLETKQVKLDLEDDVSLELFVDNLKLHGLYLQNMDNTNAKRNEIYSKYPKKILKILNQWEQRLANNNTELPDSPSIDATAPSINTIVHEMLYLGSQLPYQESPEKLNENSQEEINKIKDSFAMLARKSLENTHQQNGSGSIQTNDQSDAATSYETVATSFRDLTALRETNLNIEANSLINQQNDKSNRISITNDINDLLTDDEKENNLSY